MKKSEGTSIRAEIKMIASLVNKVEAVLSKIVSHLKP